MMTSEINELLPGDVFWISMANFDGENALCISIKRDDRHGPAVHVTCLVGERLRWLTFSADKKVDLIWRG